MLRMFTTQITGLLKELEEEHENIEDCARVISQAIISEGNVYIHGLEEMEAISLQALKGPEPFPSARPLFDEQGQMQSLHELDRVILITRSSTDTAALELAQQIEETGATVIGLSAVKNTEHRSLREAVDFHIDTKLTAPLLPQEDGTKIGMPTVMTALYAYYGLYFYVKEILDEHEV